MCDFALSAVKRKKGVPQADASDSTDSNDLIILQESHGTSTVSSRRLHKKLWQWKKPMKAQTI